MPAIDEVLTSLEAPLPNERLIFGEIDRTHEAGTMETFGRLMTGHEGGSAGLTVLDFDTDTHPEQRLDVIGIRREFTDIDILRQLARLAYPHYDDIEAQFLERPQLLEDLALELAAGGSANIIYDHSSSINGAIGGVGLRGALLTFAEREDIELGDLSETITIGEGMKRLGVFGRYPVPQILALSWDVYFSMPATLSVKDSDIPPGVSREINQALRTVHPAESDNSTGLHTFMASGMRDVPRGATRHMGPASAGTGGWMTKRPNVGIGVHLGESEPTVTAPDRLGPPLVHSRERHAFMTGLAQRITLATGDWRRYHESDDNLRRALSTES